MHRPADHDYLPAAGHDRMLPVYDLLRTLLGASRFQQILFEEAGIRPGGRVLDLGTGTGALALYVADRCPRAQVVGVDPDPKALARARRKAAGRHGSMRFEQGYGQRLPFDDASFDHVVSAFVFHHLDGDAKTATLREVGRVLTPGGKLTLVDVGGRATPDDGWAARKALRAPLLQDNLGDAIPDRMREAGLVDVGEATHRVTRRVGRVTIWKARSPGVSSGRPGTEVGRARE